MNEDLQDMYDELEELEKSIKEKKMQLIFDTTGLQGSEIAISDFWRCEKSPIGYCVYDEIEDSVHDYCVYCNKPEERD